MTAIEELPARMDRLELQIVQLRAEMRDEFSALRGEVAAGDDETCRSLREEIRAGDEETRRSLREEIRAGDEETRRSLREEIRAGDEETRREMRELFDQARRENRLLFEEAVSRIALLQNGRRPTRPRKKR